uniref:Uncharacterized protein n=1 Tax=Arundo donax TaxID=35708 RepID=A0A0A9FIW6_ARUDO
MAVVPTSFSTRVQRGRGDLGGPPAPRSRQREV